MYASQSFDSARLHVCALAEHLPPTKLLSMHGGLHNWSSTQAS